MNRDFLMSQLAYEPYTGLFRWKVKKQGVTVGRLAATGKSHGYVRIIVDKKTYFAHRLAWMFFHGESPECIDHINGDKSDNRIANLRNVDKKINNQNLKKAHADNIAGLLGVSQNRKRWAAKLYVAGKNKHLGTFDTPEAAHAAYVAAKRELHKGCTL